MTPEKNAELMEGQTDRWTDRQITVILQDTPQDEGPIKPGSKDVECCFINAN